MRISIVAALIAAVLTGCATPAEQAAQAERDVERMIQVYGPACQKLGFKPDTDPWRNCVIGLDQKNAARDSRHTYYGSPYWRQRYWMY